MNTPPPRPVEDYTDASLVLLWVNMLWIFGVVWASYSMLHVILLAAGINHLITVLERRRAR